MKRQINNPLIEKPKLNWSESNQAKALDFDDIYFSPDNGASESDFVFLRQNNIEERLTAKIQIKDSSPFTVFEFGFGTGLNFQVLSALVKKIQYPFLVRYLSCERYPLSRSDIKKACEGFSELHAPLSELVLDYPPRVPGLRTVNICGVELGVYFGDLLDALSEIGPQFEGEIDAWFLDGFAPACNPRMWGKDVFQAMTILSKVGATFGTFSAAGWVRRGLSEAGFSVTKQEGIFGKREVSNGIFLKPESKIKSSIPPWYQIPRLQKKKESSSGSGESVAVIGGGISGFSVADALIDHGYDVSLFESEQEFAPGASGNPAGLVLPLFSAEQIPLAEFSLDAFLYSIRYYSGFIDSDQFWKSSGVLRLAYDKKDQNKIEGFLGHYDPLGEIGRDGSEIKQNYLDALSENMPISSLQIDSAGVLNPKKFIAACINKNQLKANFQTGTRVSRIQKNPFGWALTLVTQKGMECVRVFDKVILANSYSMSKFGFASWLPLRQVRGQLIQYPKAPGRELLPMSFDGYRLPDFDGGEIFGATFDWANPDEIVRKEDTDELLELMRERLSGDLIPDLADVRARAAIRSATSDHFPVIGPHPNLKKYCDHFGDLHRGHPKEFYETTEDLYENGLYLFGGMGSRGLTYAPYCANILAQIIKGVPVMLPQEHLQRILPARFLVRQLNRHLGKSNPPPAETQGQALNLF